MIRQHLVEINNCVIDIREIAAVSTVSEETHHLTDYRFYFFVYLKGINTPFKFSFRTSTQVMSARIELLKRWGIETRKSSWIDMFTIHKII